MMKLKIHDVPNETCQKNSTCIFLCYAETVVLSGITLTLIGLFTGLLIIFIKKLHSTSIMNSIFMVITLIIMIIGVGLLNSPTKCVFIGCKATSSRKKIGDNLVLDMVCIRGSWNHFIDYRRGN
ncbi:unnamed protein product [Schistosoma intercalatum]|nr:unnamed protein product [Schistosoma intercalatum]